METFFKLRFSVLKPKNNGILSHETIAIPITYKEGFEGPSLEALVELQKNKLVQEGYKDITLIDIINITTPIIKKR